MTNQPHYDEVTARLVQKHYDEAARQTQIEIDAGRRVSAIEKASFFMSTVVSLEIIDRLKSKLAKEQNND